MLVVLGADAVYRLDCSSLVAEHLEAGADVTMVTTRVDRGDADRYGVVQVADDAVSPTTPTSPTSRRPTW